MNVISPLSVGTHAPISKLRDFYFPLAENLPSFFLAVNIASD